MSSSSNNEEGAGVIIEPDPDPKKKPKYVPCKEGFERNKKTNRCRKIKEIEQHTCRLYSLTSKEQKAGGGGDGMDEEKKEQQKQKNGKKKKLTRTCRFGPSRVANPTFSEKDKYFYNLKRHAAEHCQVKEYVNQRGKKYKRCSIKPKQLSRWNAAVRVAFDANKRKKNEEQKDYFKRVIQIAKKLYKQESEKKESEYMKVASKLVEKERNNRFLYESQRKPPTTWNLTVKEAIQSNPRERDETKKEYFKRVMKIAKDGYNPEQKPTQSPVSSSSEEEASSSEEEASSSEEEASSSEEEKESIPTLPRNGVWQAAQEGIGMEDFKDFLYKQEKTRIYRTKAFFTKSRYEGKKAYLNHRTRNIKST